MASPRYIIGIDLGTTNTAVAYVDTRSATQALQVFEVPQLVAPGAVDGRDQLPSFLYLAGEHDLTAAETTLPWSTGTAGEQSREGVARVVVGELARSHGARLPSRLVASSKSWLCHGGVDRYAAILPWGVEDGPRLSPVDAAARILAHIAAAWDHGVRNEADSLFIEQDLIITVPASFDEVARELTLESARRAGLPNVVLLEEPQAAFYAWMNSTAARKHVSTGERVLVFDVGGGTTDFTVIAVGDDGASFERTAVGEHLLLGGDNIDLTLAKVVEARLLDKDPTRKLDTVQWHGLVHACRMAKEALLSDGAPQTIPVTISGRGAKLIGGTLKDELTRHELDGIIEQGFFPAVQQSDVPRRARSGLQEFGLPYASDPAITRHLATFLQRHQVARIDAVLFNGGAMAPASLRDRVLKQIAAWQPDSPPPRELKSRAPALSVAEGAAQYGLVRRGHGVRIGGGTPRVFYVGVGSIEGKTTAVCLAPRGLEEGATVELPRDFTLLTNRPVSFKLYWSTTRDDKPGALVFPTTAAKGADLDTQDFAELPPIVTVLRATGRGEVAVRLRVHVTELGALEIWCDGNADTAVEAEVNRWRLVFDVRAGGAQVQSSSSESATPGSATPDRSDNAIDASPHPRSTEGQALVKDAFAGPADKLPRLFKQLEELFDTPRDQWSMATARALFDAALEREDDRKRSAEHEARWLHLTGFCLRPGVGAPLDDWRGKQMWRIFNDDLHYKNAEQGRLAWWITWRRVAGGLSKGHQHQIYLRLAQLFLPGPKSRKKWDELKPSAQEADEILRCLANLERLSPDAKMTLGDGIMPRFESKKHRATPISLWALGRVAARVPLYGPLNSTVPASKVQSWLDALLAYDWPEPHKVALSFAQMGRCTGDRSRDLNDATRTRLGTWLRSVGAERAALLVEQIVALESREEAIVFGDSLPPGLRLLTTNE